MNGYELFDIDEILENKKDDDFAARATLIAKNEEGALIVADEMYQRGIRIKHI